MSKSKNRPDIETLLGERVRFEAWLDQLMAKASQVPSHVVQRVRGDYEARLAKVVEDLRSRADDLRAESASLDEALAALDTDLTARRDARAEDELRALVGEYDEGAWAAKSAEHDGGISRLEGERGTAERELARVRDLLNEATRPSRVMRAISETEVPDEPTPVESIVEAVADDPLILEPIGSIPEVAIEAQAPIPADFVPLEEAGASEQLALVASTPPLLPLPAVPAPEPEPVAAAAPPPPPAPALAPVPAPEQPTRRPSPFDEIGFLRTVVGRATPFAGVEVPVVPPARTSSPKLEAPPIPDAPPAAPARASVPIMPAFEEPMAAEPVREQRDSKSMDAARSLKCQECGWMNYPTEWYCEKCGGELAAF